MQLKDFKGLHRDKKIIVCASGASMVNLLPCHRHKILLSRDVILLGVSHVGRYIDTDYLICVDHAFCQVNDDYNFIKNTRSKYVFTQLRDNDLFIEKAEKVYFRLGRQDGVTITDETIDYSNNTAYMACLLANYMGAKKIGMLGNDFINHHNTKNEFAVGYLNQQYLNLYLSFNTPFVNLSDRSMIKTVPYQTIEDFLR